MRINNSIRDRGLIAAVCVANDIVVRPSSDALATQLQSLIAQRKEQEFPPPQIKDAVRGLLKTGGFKPSGRNKPASEYLAQAAREDRFPAINNLVDVNNLVSLSTGLPISLLDASEFGDALLLRYGREGERYVFNSGGQDIDLAGLICACAESSDSPLGNPIKDSLTGKIKDSTRSVVAIIYAPSSMSDAAQTGLDMIAQLIASEGSASSTETFLV